MLIEQASRLCKQKETPCANQLFLFNLLMHKDKELHGKRAKTVCAVVLSMYGKTVTAKQVKQARKEVQQERRQVKTMEALTESMDSRDTFLKLLSRVRPAGQQAEPQRRPSSEQIPASNEQRGADAQQYLCITCCMKPPNIMFIACRHHVMCDSCFQQCTELKCPVCRERILNWHKSIGP